MSKLLLKDLVPTTFTEEELNIIHIALMRGMTSSNQYFRERCERLLHKILRMMTQDPSVLVQQ